MTLSGTECPCKSEKKIIGLYLSVQPSAGGMFQYAQCILRALSDIRSGGVFEVVVAYSDERWINIIDLFQLPAVRLRHLVAGTFVARVFMALFLLPNFARTLSGVLNPVVLELRRIKCNIWVFPAQDELTWQVEGPVIATIHDLMHRYERSFPESGSWWRYLLREHRFRNLANQSAAVLVDSNLGKCHVIDSYAAQVERVHSLPYIAPNYITSSVERPDFDLFYDLPEKFFFYPAQFWRHKNHWRLVNAIAAAKHTCPDMAIVFAGGLKHEYYNIKFNITNIGLEDSVRFVGYVPDDDIGGFYKRARGLVMPTFFGPTNIPPLEAMALGCPVLVSRIYAMMQQCGDAALYFDPNSISEMRDQMIRLWTDDLLHCTLAARGLIRTEAWGRVQFGSRLSEIIRDVLA